jgi:hypothetical protein
MVPNVPAGGVAWFPWFEPQQVSVPSVRIPQVNWVPAATATNWLSVGLGDGVATDATRLVVGDGSRDGLGSGLAIIGVEIAAKDSAGLELGAVPVHPE